MIKRSLRQLSYIGKLDVLFFLIVIFLLITTSFFTVSTVIRAAAMQKALDFELLQSNQAVSTSNHLNMINDKWQEKQLVSEECYLKIPDTESLPELLLELGSLANTYEILVTDFSLSPCTPLETHHNGMQLTIDITIKGPYDSIERYLSSLLTAKRHLVVARMDLVKLPDYDYTDQDSLGLALWSARLDLLAFYLLPFDVHYENSNTSDIIEATF